MGKRAQEGSTIDRIERRLNSYTTSELRLLERYWEHKVFRVCRTLGLVAAMLSLAAIGTALVVDRWEYVTIRLPTAPGNETTGLADKPGLSSVYPQPYPKGEEIVCFEGLFSKLKENKNIHTCYSSGAKAIQNPLSHSIKGM